MPATVEELAVADSLRGASSLIAPSSLVVSSLGVVLWSAGSGTALPLSCCIERGKWTSAYDSVVLEGDSNPRQADAQT